MRNQFSELRTKIPQAAQALLLEMRLRELRQTRNATQAKVARAMQVEQASKVPGLTLAGGG